MADMTEAERKYFESGGTEALETPAGTPPGDQEAPPPADGAQQQTEAQTPPAGPAQAASEEEGLDVDIQGRRQRMVDYRSLKEARDRLKATEAELASERETRARIDERLKLLSEAFTPAGDQAAQPEDQPPDPDQDIFGYARWQGRQMQRMQEQIEELRGASSSAAEELSGRQTQFELVNDYRADAARVAAEKQDFVPAYNNLIAIRTAQLRTQGYSDREIPGIINEEEMALVERARTAGKSPAEMIYDIAKSFGPLPAPQTNGSTAPAGGSQSTGPAGGSRSPANVASEELTRIAQGQAASRSLSSGGGQPGGAMTIETLANMSQHDFNRYALRNPRIVEELLGKGAH